MQQKNCIAIFWRNFFGLVTLNVVKVAKKCRVMKSFSHSNDNFRQKLQKIRQIAKYFSQTRDYVLYIYH